MAQRPPLIFQDAAMLDPARQAMLLDRVKQLHGTGIQTDVSWGDVRRGQGYDLQKFNALVNAARMRGLGVTMRLMGTPLYQAKSNPGMDTALSASTPNSHLMKMFARDMSKAFAGRVGNFAIWNEPNVGSFLNVPTAERQAAAYRRLYDAGFAGVKQGNRHAQVGFGEITSMQPNTPGYQSTIGFLKAALAANKAPVKADYVSIHPYQWSDPTQHVGNPWFGGISNLGAVQNELLRQFRAGRLTTTGGHRTPLKLSEFGYKHDAQGDQSVRAKWMGDALDLAGRAHVAGMNLYQLVPSKAGDYWDSSIADPYGNLPPEMRRAITGR